MGKLGRVTDFAVLIACVVLTARLSENYYRRWTAPEEYKAGETIADTKQLDLRGHHTLLMYTATTCHFCQESMPFYRRMTNTARDAGVRVIGVATEDLGVNSDYLTRNGVVLDRVVSAQDNRLHLRGTPTLILVGKDGTVENVWLGKLPDEREREVLEAVKKG